MQRKDNILVMTLQNSSFFLVIKNLLFTLIAPGTVGIYIPYLLSRSDVAGTGLIRSFSIIFFAAGGLIYLWCLWHFASFGRGTPAPIAPPKKLVVKGLYKYVRNPMYVGVLAAIAGWIILYRNLILLSYAILVWLIVHLFVVFYEEPHLQQLFGREYQDYCARVGRWLPKFRNVK